MQVSDEHANVYVRARPRLLWWWMVHVFVVGGCLREVSLNVN